MTMHVHYAVSHKKFFDTKQLRGQLLAALTNSQNRIHKYLKEYTATWNHPVVWYFKGATGYKGGDIRVDVMTDDEVFWYLEFGTDIRYAVMTQDFVAKTAPGRIHSQQGQGGFDHFDPMGVQGIEARNVLAEIAKLDAPKFQADVLKVTANITFFPYGSIMP